MPRWVLGALLLAMALAAGCTQPPNVPDFRAKNVASASVSAPLGAVVTVGYPTFGPSAVTIHVGQAVKWVWSNYYQPDQVVFADGVKSPIMTQGSWERVFEKPGTYVYYSPFHRQARGVVYVLP